MHKEQPIKAQKTVKEEVALLLPFFGTLLITPPLVNLFIRPVVLFGIPLETLYLFVVWLLVVLATVVLSRLRLFRDPRGDGERRAGARQHDHSSLEKPTGNS